MSRLAEPMAIASIAVMENANDQSDLSHGLLASLGRGLASQWFVLVVVAFALLLTFSSIHNGLIWDDYYHRAVLSGSDQYGQWLRGPQAMMRFLTGNPEHAQAWMDIGFLPWWTDPNIKAEFMQLIPTQTHILDYWLWPDRPELMHLHNLAWFALLIFLAARFYRRILGPTWMAGVAVLLFAIEDGHAFPIGWICNRNTLIAASFGIGCLMAHDAWRRDGKRWAFGLALVLWAASLCSKEAGIATCAYLFAYALWLDESRLGQRFLTLVPYGVVLVVWRVVRDALGYGVANMGHYIDPITDPARFATALLERYPVFLFGQWAGLSDISLFFSSLLGSAYWWIAAGYVGLLGLLFWPLLRRDRIARFFATGMLLAVIPICATFPMDRLLMFVGLGAFGLLVRFWNAVFAADGPRPATLVWRAVAVPVALLLVLLHIVAAPRLLAVRSASPFGPPEFSKAVVHGPRFDQTIEEQDLVVVNPPLPAMAMGYWMINYEHDGMPSPQSVRVLAVGLGRVDVKRTGDRTIEVRRHAGYFAGYPGAFADNLFRSERRPLQVGEQVQLARMTATVLDVADGRPQVVAFRFDAPLEDPSLRWLDGDFNPWTPPELGEEVSMGKEWNLREVWTNIESFRDKNQ